MPPYAEMGHVDYSAADARLDAVRGFAMATTGVDRRASGATACAIAHTDSPGADAMRSPIHH